jgi:hypothetical protein
MPVPCGEGIRHPDIWGVLLISAGQFTFGRLRPVVSVGGRRFLFLSAGFPGFPVPGVVVCLAGGKVPWAPPFGVVVVVAGWLVFVVDAGGAAGLIIVGCVLAEAGGVVGLVVVVEGVDTGGLFTGKPGSWVPLGGWLAAGFWLPLLVPPASGEGVPLKGTILAGAGALCVVPVGGGVFTGGRYIVS